MNRQNLLALGAIYVLLGAVLVVTWVASSVLFVLLLALVLVAGGVVSLVAGLRRPAAPAKPPPARPEPVAEVASHPAAGPAPQPADRTPRPPATAPAAQPSGAVAVGARVRFDPHGVATAKTQGHEVLLRSHSGTVTRVIGAEAVEVAWDAAGYEEFVDLVPTSAGMRAAGGDVYDLDAFAAAVHPDHLRAIEAEPVAPVSSAAETAPPAPVPARNRCASCGRDVLTTRQFVSRAAQSGYDVDPVTGDASTGPGQALFDQLESARGYVCQACGRSHCTDCLMHAPPHPVTHGPRCPSCAEGPHAPLED